MITRGWGAMLALALALSLAVAGETPALTQGLLHYWSFDRADANGLRDSAGDCPLLGYRKSGEWLTAGVVGDAVDVATGVYLDGTACDLSPANFTVAGWIRYTAAASTSKARAILSAGNHYSPLNKPWVLQLTAGKLVLAGGAKSVQSPEPVPEGRWVHVAAVVTAPEAPGDAAARTVRLYLDGREIAAGSVTITPQVAQVLVGNTHRGGPDYFCGQFDELAVWARALSAAEIAALQRLGGDGKALSAVVTGCPTVGIRAEKAPDGAGGGTFVLSRDSDRGELRVHVSYSGLGLPGTDYAPLATLQLIPDGAREIRIPVRRLDGAVAIGRDDVKATLEPGILYTIRDSASAARVWLTPDWPAPPPARPKKIFAHYMGCYPAGAGATAHHRAIDAPKVRHDSTDRMTSGGGRFRNWPLVPDGMRVSLEASADLEIRRALRGGIDGFAVDAWAGGQSAQDMFSALLKVARDKDYPFEVTVCLDPGVLGFEGMQKALRWIMQEHGQNPKLARRDGKPLIFGYLSSFIGFQHGALALKQKPEFADTDLKALQQNRELRKTKAGWLRMAEGHRELEKAAGTPLFFHYCMGAFFNGVGGTPAEILQAAGFMAGQFGAVGEFKASGPGPDAMAEVVRAAGAEWAQPMYYQYENLFFQGNDHLSQGSELLRRHWEAARRNQSTLIQFVTWNDYTENTHLAPAYETRYAVFDLNRYFVDWWKTGTPPTPDKDKIYLFHRKYPADATIFPFRRITGDPAGVIEVLTILTKPATVRLVERGDAWDAPAGLSWKHFPVTPGAVKAEVLRGGKVVQSLESPDPITDRPCEQMKSMLAISTEDVRHWRADFGDLPPAPLLRGLYADDDKDGLPNWFEMYWFGTWLDWSTATKADPTALGADGKPLRQHYLDQTDPTRVATPPAPGGGTKAPAP
jgi:hypothetical protein